MISRRKILSLSKDDLTQDEEPASNVEEEEDVWHNKDKLIRDHVHEVLQKWESIDDEIWAKIIVFERNRRVAKAYARAPVLSVNGSDDGFDGFRIGLGGFENPLRDAKTEEAKKQIGPGCKFKMDNTGNILVKRFAKSSVYVKYTHSAGHLQSMVDVSAAAKMASNTNAISNEVLKLPNGSLESEKPVVLFDMKKFQQNVKRELNETYPDRARLEAQCVCAVAFVKTDPELLNVPCWILLVNVVAIDMLNSKLPPLKVVKAPQHIRDRPRIPAPDEDIYSVAGSGNSSGNKSEHRPPQLPPRDIYEQNDDDKKANYQSLMMDEERFRRQLEKRHKQEGSKQKGEKRGDDPYYVGLRARIPNFAAQKSSKSKAEGIYGRAKAAHKSSNGASDQQLLQQQQQQQQQQQLLNRGAKKGGSKAEKGGHYGFMRHKNPTTWLPQTTDSSKNAAFVTEWESFWDVEQQA